MGVFVGCGIFIDWYFRLAHPKPGDIILDPMCGGGSITIEVGVVGHLCNGCGHDRYNLIL